MLAALQPQLGVLQQHDREGTHLHARVGQLEDHPAGALRRLERELQSLPVARIALDALDLRQLLHARLRLFGLRRLVAEALDEALHALDLRLLLVDRLALRDLARGLLAAPVVPAAGEEARAAGLQLEHGGADGLQEPAVVGDQHDRGVEARQRLLQPLQRLDVEVVGGLVQQQHVGVRRQRPRQRGARQLPAGEGVQRALQVLLGEAQPARHHRRAVAPQVAPERLQPRLRAGVAVEGRLLGARCPALPHLLLQLRQLALRRQLLRAAGQHVLAQRHPALARGALVVQRHARALLQAELAFVDRLLPGQHPQQRRLAGAVAPGDRHPLAPLQLERHPAQQRFAGDLLVEIRCDQHSHVAHGRPRLPIPSSSPMRRLLWSLPTAAALLLLSAPAALAMNDGRGFYGATDDKVVTLAGFILIIFFPTFILLASLLQKRLEKRKDARVAAARSHANGDRFSGGW